MSGLAVYEETSTVATYMKAKFPIVLHITLDMQLPDVDIQHPHEWSMEFALEVDQALDVLARAFHNQGFSLTLTELLDLISISFNQLGCEAICRSCWAQTPGNQQRF